jgi:hypothetical protein
MKPSALLIESHGAELIRLLNEAMQLAGRTIGWNDLFLHYRDGEGWRARLDSNEEGTQEWIAAPGPWAGLIVALNDAVEPIRKQIIENDNRREQQQQSKAKARKKPLA